MTSVSASNCESSRDSLSVLRKCKQGYRTLWGREPLVGLKNSLIEVPQECFLSMVSRFCILRMKAKGEFYAPQYFLKLAG